MAAAKAAGKVTDKKISVIIIAYRVEAYIVQCLESLLAQSHKNLEIILVAGHEEDMSENECSRICREYAGRDGRIKLIDTPARGVSDARNKGLAVATGDYIGFVDGDDYIEADMFEHLLYLAESGESDIAICGRFYEYKNGSLQDEAGEKNPLVMTPEQALDLVLAGGGFYLHCWDKLFRAELFEGISFPVDRFVEDRVVVDKLLARADKIIYDRTPRYHFRERWGSMSKTGAVARNNYLANKELCSFVRDNYPALSGRVDSYMIYELITAIQNVYMSEEMSSSEKRSEYGTYRQSLLEYKRQAAEGLKKNKRLYLKLLLALHCPRLLAANTKRKKIRETLERFP